jgi:hypothetical protein
MKKKQIEHYFKARVKEVQHILEDVSPWGFVCAAAFLDCLSKLVAGQDNKRKGYKDFVKDYLAKINPSYATFKYKSGSKDLPEQLYHVFRCGIVHQFSLVPDQQSLNSGGQLRSIILCHRKESKRKNLPHLSQYSSAKISDAAVFVAEDFGKDLKKVVKLIFSSQAKTITPEITEKMKDWVKKHPPIMGGF